MDGEQSKKRKMGNQSVDDLLSDLPLCIIHCILALLPIQDAVRTCVLSREWRYKWVSLPDLVFDDTCVDKDGKSVSDWRDHMNNFINSALFLHKGPIQKFRLSANLMSPDIDQWLLHLSRNKIREIHLEQRYCSMLLVHSSLYSCQNLTHLELFNCELCPLPPTFKGFSFLRNLVLDQTEVHPNTLESLARSPLLEKFKYYNSKWSLGSELRFSAPNLKYFHFTGSFEGMSLYAPHVAQVFVRWTKIRLLTEQVQQKSPVCNYAKFFGSCTNLERFTAKRFFTEHLSIGIESYRHSLVFRHLKFIELSQVSFTDMKQMSVLGYLIMGAPNLQVLKISCAEDASGSSPNSFLDFGCPPNFTLEKLRIVSIRHVRGLLYEMAFIKHLLKSSPVLETMKLHYQSELLYQARFNLMDRMAGYHRASPNVEFFPPLDLFAGLFAHLWEI